jgi:AraC-like DNA-binding protein
MPIPDVFDMDLSRVAASRRVAMWKQWSAETFGRIQVFGCPEGGADGFIRGVRLGPGRLLRVRSAGRLLTCNEVPHVTPLLTVVLQIGGYSRFDQGGRSCELRAGDICVIDSMHPFQQHVSLGSEVMLLQVQRPEAMSRYPELLHSSGSACTGAGPTAAMVRGAMQAALPAARQLSPGQRERLCHTLFDLATLLFGNRSATPREHFRQHEALAEIDDRLGDSALDAKLLASRIGLSRRRLDEIFVRHFGRPVAAYIRERRLERARDMLGDARFAEHTITDVALAAGFEDMSHFSRAFKSRFGIAPSAWRSRGAAARAQ